MKFVFIFVALVCANLHFCQAGNTSGNQVSSVLSHSKFLQQSFNLQKTVSREFQISDFFSRTRDKIVNEPSFVNLKIELF